MINLFKKNWRIISIGFICICFGVLIGVFWFNSSLYNLLNGMSIYKYYILVTPNPKFLSDVAAFQAVILAFLMPISIEITSRLSERYKSEVVSSLFKDKWENRLFPFVLLFNIILAICLRFFVGEKINDGLPLFLAWIVLLVFLFSAYLTYRVVAITKIMITDTKRLLDLLYEKVEDYLE